MSFLGKIGGAITGAVGSYAKGGGNWWSPLLDLGVSALASKGAKKGQKQAAGQSSAIEAQQMQLAQAQEARSKQTWDRYNSVYVPLENQAIDRLGRPISPEAASGRAMADVEGQVATQRGALTRQLGRRGISSKDGAVVDAESRLALGAGLGRAAAGTTARRGAVDDTTANMIAAANMGRGLPAQAASLGAGAGPALSDLAHLSGQRLLDANQTAGAAGAGLGDALGGMATLVEDIVRKRSAPPSGSPSGTVTRGPL